MRSRCKLVAEGETHSISEKTFAGAKIYKLDI